jgi:hypothetical protein
MIKLNKKQVAALLKLITNPEEKRLVKTFLKDLGRINSNHPMQIRKDILKERSARKALDVIARVGLEIGKHVAIEELIHFIK